MASEGKAVDPSLSKYTGFDHVHWWVGNAKMSADWYVTRMGFKKVAYKGLETGDRDVTTHVIAQGDIRFAFSSPMNPGVDTVVMGDEMGRHHKEHGDGVKDVAFAVTDCRAIFEAAKARGAEVVREPEELKDENGTVLIATVKTYGDTLHSFVQRSEYSGPFLPGYKSVDDGDDVFAGVTDPIGLDFIDHVVGNMPDGGMIPAVEWYEKKLEFHRFWSVDDSQIHTEYSSLRSTVMANDSEVIKMPINEPASGKRKSQIQEYVDYYGGPGVQHIALNTRDILSAISNLRKRGVKFLRVPDTYYDLLAIRIEKAGIEIKESMETIKALNILVDFDESGYLLQLFTSTLMDRPTVFLEIIQREGNTGFGAGNFKSLFESIEREQEARGNLTAA